MKKSCDFSILLITSFLFLLTFIFNNNALSAESAGTIYGRFVWADNTPITDCKVKIFDKLDVFKSTNADSLFHAVQNIRIARDAKVKEVSVDSEGRFKFTNLPPGNYYIFFKTKGNFAGEGWSYRFYAPQNVLFLSGHQEKPEQYELKENGNLKIKDFELTRLLKPEDPQVVSGKPGVFKFQWPETKPGMTAKIIIEHKEYHPNKTYPLKIAKEVQGNTFKVSEDEPLIPGKHQFTIDILTPSLRKYASSRWISFVVPGDVYQLTIKKINDDSKGTKLSWSGSSPIKFVRLSLKDGSINKVIKEKTITLPPYNASKNSYRTWFISPLNSEQKEMIPGWGQFYTQTGINSR